MNATDPAFPITDIIRNDYGVINYNTMHGMDLRTWMAAMAMQALLSGKYTFQVHGKPVERDANILAYAAIEQADALIEALNNTLSKSCTT